MAGDPLTELGSLGKATAGAANGEAQLANRLLHGLHCHKPSHYKDAQSERAFYDYLDGEGQEEKRRYF